MSQSSSGISSILIATREFLGNVHYIEYFMLLPIILFVVAVVAYSVSAVMTICMPSKFGHDHRKALYRNARISLIFSILIQVFFWLWGSVQQIQLLRNADYLVCCIFASLGVICVFAASILMIFRGKGTRVFAARNLGSLSLKLFLIALFIVVYAWFIMSV